MRVIAGQYKGAGLISPTGKARPTTDLVKGSLFSILAGYGCLDGARCLDVFCGSGSLGIEALSRGARSCVFVDVDTRTVRANTDKLKLSERIIRADYRRAFKMLKGEKFELVFCDPPYNIDHAPEVFELMTKYGILNDGGLVVFEHSCGLEMRLSEYKVIERRVFGESAFSLIMQSKE